MNKQNSNYKSAAEQYKLCGDPTKEKVSSAVVLTRTLQIGTIEETLGIFYEAMKWIENSTVDLTFQLQEVQRKLNLE